tara:strand:+ start:2929 stop:3933 length:1005 start_codon:yes stop_codon:yes gene_type:complete
MTKVQTAPLSSRLALIAGSGRSGTSFLAKLIDASSDVLYRHEPDISARTKEFPQLPDCSNPELYADIARAYLYELTWQRDSRTMGSTPIYSKRFRSSLANRAMPALVYGAKALERVRLPARVPDLIENSREPLVLIKSVSSVLRTPIFAHAVPSLKVIHIVRHPCAVLASQIRGIKRGLMQSSDFTDELFSVPDAHNYGLSKEQIVAAPFEVQRAFRWMVHNDAVYRRLKDHPNYIFISYEKLCVELQSESKRLCEFLNMPIDDQMANYVRLVTEDGTKDGGYFSVIKNTLSALSKWEDEVDPDVAASVIDLVQGSEIGRKTLAEYATQRAKLV